MDISKLNRDVLGTLRLALDAKDPDDASHDDRIARLTAFEAFDRYMVWWGIIGYSSRIWRNIDNLRAADQK
jgi:hypothetical protein